MDEERVWSAWTDLRTFTLKPKIWFKEHRNPKSVIISLTHLVVLSTLCGRIYISASKTIALLLLLEAGWKNHICRNVEFYRKKVITQEYQHGLWDGKRKENVVNNSGRYARQVIVSYLK